VVTDSLTVIVKKPCSYGKHDQSNAVVEWLSTAILCCTKEPQQGGQRRTITQKDPEEQKARQQR